MTRSGRAGLRSPESASGVGGGLRAEGVHEQVVLAGEDVVVEAHPDASSCRGRRSASWPAHCGFIGSRGLEQRQVAQASRRRRRAAPDRHQQQLGGVAGVALHAPARASRRSRRSARRPTTRCTVLRVVRGARDRCGLAAVRRTSAGRRSRRRAPRSMRRPGGSRACASPASGRSTSSTVVAQPTAIVSGALWPSSQVREPVVGHELDPERRQDVEERRLLVVATGVRRRRRAARAPRGTCRAVRLGAREEPAADHLRVRPEQAEAVAVPVAGQLVARRARGRSPRTRTLRANGMPAEPISGFRMSLQMPVSVRKRISSPPQSCSPAPPTAA